MASNDNDGAVPHHHHIQPDDDILHILNYHDSGGIYNETNHDHTPSSHHHHGPNSNDILIHDHYQQHGYATLDGTNHKHQLDHVDNYDEYGPADHNHDNE